MMFAMNALGEEQLEQNNFQDPFKSYNTKYNNMNMLEKKKTSEYMATTPVSSTTTKLPKHPGKVKSLVSCKSREEQNLMNFFSL